MTRGWGRWASSSGQGSLSQRHCSTMTASRTSAAASRNRYAVCIQLCASRQTFSSGLHAWAGAQDTIILSWLPSLSLWHHTTIPSYHRHHCVIITSSSHHHIIVILISSYHHTIIPSYHHTIVNIISSPYYRYISGLFRDCCPKAHRRRRTLMPHVPYSSPFPRPP